MRDVRGVSSNQPTVERFLPVPPLSHYLPVAPTFMTTSLVQLAPRIRRDAVPATTVPGRKPAWLKVPAPGGPNYVALKRMMRELGLHTVCEEAHCPNVGECWEHRAATFMILGDVCTRNCSYCAVAHGTPQPVDHGEPARLGIAVERMKLRHVVITSVDRDDLAHGGAESFAACIAEIRNRLSGTSVEVLIPDFNGDEDALRIVVDAGTGHPESQRRNIERLYAWRDPGPLHARTRLAAAVPSSSIPPAPKSGLYVRDGRGMGRAGRYHARRARPARRLLTLGQYLRPSSEHLRSPVTTPPTSSPSCGHRARYGMRHWRRDRSFARAITPGSRSSAQRRPPNRESHRSLPLPPSPPPIQSQVTSSSACCGRCC